MWPGDPIRLRHDYTTDQLIEELARRANARETIRPAHWCHDCKKHITWADGPTPNKPMPDNYNACSAGHEMKFKIPEDFGDEYGFYRTVCPDRDEQPKSGD